MFQRCVAAQLSKDHARAQLYAAQCADIRKMAKIVFGSEIALERAVIRLETVEQLGQILVLMLPVVDVVRETKGKIEGVIPDVASELRMVDSLLSDTVKDTGTMQARDADVFLRDEEARRIFEESSAYAEQTIREQFPELPSVKERERTSLEAEGIGLMLGQRTSEMIFSTEETMSEPHAMVQAACNPIQGLAHRVYDYITSHVRQGGKLNLSECARELMVERNDVVKAVETLREEGRIVLQKPEAPVK